MATSPALAKEILLECDASKDLYKFYPETSEFFSILSFTNTGKIRKQLVINDVSCG